MIHSLIDLGTETRAIECIQDGDAIYFVETTSGDLTKGLFGCGERVQSVTFKPIAEFGLEDVQMIVEDYADTIFFNRIIEALNFWGVEYNLNTQEIG